MDSDLASLAGEITPYVTAAVSAYGVAVLTRVRDQAADATVGLGRRILQRIFGTRAEGDVPQAVADLAADPGDLDLQAALRVEIRKMLAIDAQLADDLRGMVASAPGMVSAADHAVAAGRYVNIAASESGIAAGVIHGNVAPSNPPVPGPANA